MSIQDLLLHAMPQPGGFRNVAPTQARPNLNSVRVVDVREPDEYVGPLGHLDGALLVPLATVADAVAGWDREAPMLLVCRSGGRSARAAIHLAGMGFTQLYNLDGGMLAWDAAGLPVQRGTDNRGAVVTR